MANYVRKTVFVNLFLYILLVNDLIKQSSATIIEIDHQFLRNLEFNAQVDRMKKTLRN
jgi:hypothetical protein